MSARTKRVESRAAKNDFLYSALNAEKFKELVAEGVGNFEGVILRNIKVDFDITECNFKNAIFDNVTFTKSLVHFTGVIFERTTFIDCVLGGDAFFGDAKFKKCRFYGSKIGWKGQTLDVETQLEKCDTKDWDKLKAAYTGNGARFHVLLAMLYFIPLVIQIAVLSAYGVIQEVVPYLHPKDSESNSVIWYVLSSNDVFGYKFIFIFALIYQVLRFYLTYKIGVMADNETYARKMPSYSTIGRLNAFHGVNWLLTVFVIIGAVANIAELMGMTFYG